MKKKQFTLIEVLIVMAIIAVLAGMVLGIAALAKEKNSEMRTEATLTMIIQALEQYKLKYGYYPYPGNNFIEFKLDKVNLRATNGSSCARNNIIQFVEYENLRTNGKVESLGTNIEQVTPKDGYGFSFYYRYPGLFNKTSYDLVSPGKNGGPGNYLNYSIVGIPDDKAIAHLGKEDDHANFKR